MTPTPDMDQPASPPTLRQIFLAFSKIGLFSFGGGLSGWMLQEFVYRRRWMTEDAFFNGLAIAQAFPGVNVVNMAIWIGFQLRGGWGSLAAGTGMVVPTMFVIIALVAVLDELVKYPVTSLALAGAATAAIGLSLNIGLRALRRNARPLPAVLSLATFSALFFLHMPLYVVVLTLAPLSIALAYWRSRGGKPT